MIITLDVKAYPVSDDVEYPTWYTIPYFDVCVPNPETESDGLTTFTFKGKNDENYVVSIKVRQELDPLYRDRIWLDKEYTEMERSMADIADQFGITPAAINQWLNKYDIPTRNRGRNHE